MPNRVSNALPVSLIDKLVRSIAASTRRSAFSLVLLCVVVYIPGLWTLPPVDRDESRFAQASRQMFESVALPADQRDPVLHSGGLAVPMLADKPRLNKPPMIYWLQTASAAALTQGDPLSDRIWHYRVPSLLGAIVSVLVTWRLGCRMAGRTAGLIAGASLAVCPVLAWESHQARADVVLLAATTIAMSALWRIWVTPSRQVCAPLVFWLALAFGILTKGPVTPMIALLTCVGVSFVTRDWRWIARTRPVLGTVILLGAITPWLVAVAAHVGFGEYADLVVSETLGRGAKSREGHWGPPGYHIALFAVLFWPGCLLAVIGVWRAIKASARVRRTLATKMRNTIAHSDKTSLFLVSWIVPTWLVFEVYATKLPHYTLPVYPAIAIIAARALVSAPRHRWPGPQSAVAWLGHGVWIIAGCVIATAPLTITIFASRPAQPPPWLIAMSIAAACLCMILMVIATMRIRAAQYANAAALGVLGIACSSSVLIGAVFPSTPRLWISAAIMSATPADARDQLAVSGYTEDSLVFHTRAKVLFVPPDSAFDWMAAHPGLPLWVNESQFSRETLDRLRALAGPPVAEVSGFNYSKGKHEALCLYHHVP